MPFLSPTNSLSLLSLFLFFFTTSATTRYIPNFSHTLPRNQTVHDLLPTYGFPKGLIPDAVNTFSLSSNGDFQVNLHQPCYVEFEDFVHYDKKITGKLKYGTISDVSGIQAKKLFVWIPITEIASVSNSRFIEFHVGFLYQKLPAEQFQSIPICKSKSCLGRKEEYPSEKAVGPVYEKIPVAAQSVTTDTNKAENSFAEFSTEDEKEPDDKEGIVYEMFPEATQSVITDTAENSLVEASTEDEKHPTDNKEGYADELFPSTRQTISQSYKEGAEGNTLEEAIFVEASKHEKNNVVEEGIVYEMFPDATQSVITDTSKNSIVEANTEDKKEPTDKEEGYVYELFPSTRQTISESYKVGEEGNTLEEAIFVEASKHEKNNVVEEVFLPMEDFYRKIYCRKNSCNKLQVVEDAEKIVEEENTSIDSKKVSKMKMEVASNVNYNIEVLSYNQLPLDDKKIPNPTYESKSYYGAPILPVVIKDEKTFPVGMGVIKGSEMVPLMKMETISNSKPDFGFVSEKMPLVECVPAIKGEIPISIEIGETDGLELVKDVWG